MAVTEEQHDAQTKDLQKQMKAKETEQSRLEAIVQRKEQELYTAKRNTRSLEDSVSDLKREKFLLGLELSRKKTQLGEKEAEWRHQRSDLLIEIRNLENELRVRKLYKHQTGSLRLRFLGTVVAFVVIWCIYHLWGVVISRYHSLDYDFTYADNLEENTGMCYKRHFYGD